MDFDRYDKKGWAQIKRRKDLSNVSLTIAFPAREDGQRGYGREKNIRKKGVWGRETPHFPEVKGL